MSCVPVTMAPMRLVRADPETQMRAGGLDADHLERLQEAIEEAGDLNAVLACYDRHFYWIYDGHHRHWVYDNKGRKFIPVIPIPGGLREAKLLAASANAGNVTLPRTNADKRLSVNAVLDDEEWSQQPNTWIATRCAVRESFVRKIRQERKADAEGDSLAQCEEEEDTDTPDLEDIEKWRSQLPRSVTKVILQASNLARATDKALGLEASRRLLVASRAVAEATGEQARGVLTHLDAALAALPEPPAEADAG